MIRKLLIANRGEIACRIVRTARRMGIATVAVHSDADRDALHVRTADEAVRIGPAPVAESYLRGDRIIEAALAIGADAIHPGYGFLSENPGFVEAVEAAGLTFVGPSAQSIRAMGLKDAAKRLMEKAGVPVVPGYHGERQEADFLAAEAKRIGYPVLVKARAGGGGKGMRRVDRPEAFAEALAAARREAEAAFGDPDCLVEKYVSSPRHIEIQVFGDAHGNVVHLFERDCSLQRRHQKVIEEAPAPGMSDTMREAMGAAAVKAANAIDYRGAGTIEFIVDASHGLREDRFYFMEMNTRLQVEHPVTEAITGLDLVELQLRVAGGERLPFAQSDISIRGHAFEARLYAEDPARGFLPATGRLDRLRFPSNARVDTGVAEGDAITPHYDPMIAKIIVHGPDRNAALGQLRAALQRTQVAGTTTNLDFLTRLASHKGFAAGDVDTGLIDRDLSALTTPRPSSPSDLAIAALARLDALAPSTDPFANYRHFGPATRTVVLVVDGVSAELMVSQAGDTATIIDAEGAPVRIEVMERGAPARIAIDGRQEMIEVSAHREGWTVFRGSAAIDVRLPKTEARSGPGADSDGRIFSPMPGTVRLVAFGAGAAVEAGATIAIVEAMKMEHSVKSPRAGIVAETLVAVGDQVTDGALLARLEPLA